MKITITRILKLFLGWFLIVLGIVGLFLPFLQGIALIIGGIAILASEYPWARLWMNRIKKKFKTDKKIQKNRSKE